MIALLARLSAIGSRGEVMPWFEDGLSSE